MNTTRLMQAAQKALDARTPKDLVYSRTELRAALEEAKQAPLIIVINSSGSPCLTDMNGNEFPNVLVIDWLALEAGGYCPVCGSEQIPDTTCDHCGLNVWDENNLQGRARTAAIELWRKGKKDPQ